jgi:hypothetical protein
VPGGSVTISIDNAVAGSLNKFRTTAPASCADTAGTFVKTVTAGVHLVYAASATQPGITWTPTNYTVPANGCMVIKLF